MNGWNKLLENIKNILKKANINNEYEIEYLTTYECEKKMVKNSLVYFHGHIYKVVEVGYVVNNSTQLEPLDDFNYINGAKLVDILNPKNKGIRTFQYLSSGTVYLIKFKQDNDLENINESIKNNQNNKPYKFIAYHGSVEDNLKLDKNRAFYLTEDYKLAKDFAYREVYNDGLYEGEIPIVYKFKGEFKNPYYLTENEYDDEGQDSNINYKKWVDMGVDGIVFASKGYSTYYIVIDPSTIKLIGKKYLPYDKKSLYRTDTNEDDSFDYKLNESVHFNDLAYNSAFEKFEELTVLKNPSVEWIKNELTKVDLRFIYNPYKNILYVWNGSKWMHGDVMEVVDMNLAKENNIIGVLSPSLVEVWSEISPNDDEEEAMMLSKKYAGKLFKSIYPFGYQIRVYS